MFTTMDIEKKRRTREPTVVFRLSGVGLAWYIIPLPTIAFISCLVISLWKDFKQSTATHCQVPNFLPTISSAIGGYTPQRYIWRICIALHCAPRLMIALMYYRYYTSYPVYKKPRLFKFLAAVNSLLHILENLALVFLSYVSSTENYRIHEASFILFMVFSQFYMLLTVILYRWSRQGRVMTPPDQKSYNLKVRLFIFNISCLAVAAYLFYRHNKYCEPGVYTWFALAEYGIVLSNIVFNGHMLVLDLSDGNHMSCSVCDPCPESKRDSDELKEKEESLLTGRRVIEDSLSENGSEDSCACCSKCRLNYRKKKRD